MSTNPTDLTSPSHTSGSGAARNPSRSNPNTRGADESVTPAVAGIRRFSRIDVDVEVILQDDDGWEYPTRAVDLSASGIFVESEFLFDEGTEHTIIFRDPEREVLFRLQGRVVRVEDGCSSRTAVADDGHDTVAGMAYEFHQASPETRRRLQSAIGLDDNPPAAH